MLAKINSTGLHGIDAVALEVEVASSCESSFIIAGLPDAANKESGDRVRSALQNCGFEIPWKPIIVNLAPVDLHKEGAAYDLPIALAILVATSVIGSETLNEFLVADETTMIHSAGDILS
jgi:magnesium chelatase family protein